MVGATGVTSAHFMLECDMDPSSNEDQYLVLPKKKMKTKKKTIG